MINLQHTVNPMFPLEVEQERQDSTSFLEDGGNFVDYTGNRWSSLLDFTEDYEPDPDFNLLADANRDLFEGLVPDAKRDLLDAAPQSRKEAETLAVRYKKRFELRDKLALDGGLMWLLASEFVTPESVVATAATAGVSTGVSALAAAGRGGVVATKVANSATAMRAAQAFTGEAGYAAGSAMFNQGTSQKEMMENFLIGAAVGSAFVGAPVAYSKLKGNTITESLSGAIRRDITNDAARAGNPRDTIGIMPSIHRKLAKADSPLLNKVNDLLFSNPVVSRHGEAQFQAADVAKDAKFVSVQRMISRKVEQSFQTHLKVKGIRRWGKAADQEFTNIQKAIFEHAVVHQRPLDELTDPNVRSIADALLGDNGLYANGLKYAQKGGVEGSEGLVHSFNYVPRRWHREYLFDLQRRFDRGIVRASVTEAITVGIARGYARAGHTLPDNDIVRAMARAVYKRASETRKGYQSANSIDEENMIAMLEDIGADESLIDRAVSQLNTGKGADDKGRTGYLQHRIPMDLDVTVGGLDKGMRLAELMRQDIYDLGNQYLNSMVGMGELAKRGYKSTKAIDKLREDVAAELAETEDADHVLSIFNKAIGDLMGRPLEAELGNLGSTSRRNFLRLRQFVSATMLGGAGAATIPEATAVAARTGFLRMLSDMPVVRNWNLSNRRKLTEEFEKHGVYFNSPRFEQLHSDYFADGLKTSRNELDRLLNGINNGKYGLLNMSGMAQLDTFARRNAFIGFADSIFKQANGKTTRAGVTRQELGLTVDDWETIQGYMRTSGKIKRGAIGNEVQYFDMDDWLLPDGSVDEVIIDKFLTGLHKLTNNSVIRGTIGERLPVTESPVARVFLQFRQILTLSVDKMLLAGIHNRDVVTMINFMGGLVGAFIANEVKLGIKSSGADSYYYEETRDKYSGAENLMQAVQEGDTADLQKALAYTLGYHPLLGSVMEVGSIFSSLVLGQDMSGRRVNASDTMLGMPASGVIENTFKGLRHSIETGEVDWNNLRYFVPLNNSIVGHTLYNTVLRD